MGLGGGGRRRRCRDLLGGEPLGLLGRRVRLERRLELRRPSDVVVADARRSRGVASAEAGFPPARLLVHRGAAREEGLAPCAANLHVALVGCRRREELEALAGRQQPSSALLRADARRGCRLSGLARGAGLARGRLRARPSRGRYPLPLLGLLLPSALPLRLGEAVATSTSGTAPSAAGDDLAVGVPLLAGGGGLANGVRAQREAQPGELLSDLRAEVGVHLLRVKLRCLHVDDDVGAHRAKELGEVR